MGCRPAGDNLVHFTAFARASPWSSWFAYCSAR